MGSIYLRKYGVATTVDFCLYELDGTDLVTTAASATGDITLYRDEAPVETLDADVFVDEGAIYSLVLSLAEMQAARIIVCIVDQSNPKIWLDKVLIIETYGNASAQHAFDLASATVTLSSATEGQIDAIETDTNEIQGKLPTNKIMGSSVATDKDDEIDAIKAKTDLIPADPATETNVNANETKIDTLQTDVTAIKGYVDTEVGAIKAKTDLIPADIATQLDTNIPAIKTKTDALPTDPADASDIATLVGNIQTDVTAMKKILANRWKIDTVANTLTVYEDDGTTPYLVFDLLDSAGNPASTNVFERAP